MFRFAISNCRFPIWHFGNQFLESMFHISDVSVHESFFQFLEFGFGISRFTFHNSEFVFQKSDIKSDMFHFTRYVSKFGLWNSDDFRFLMSVWVLQILGCRCCIWDFRFDFQFLLFGMRVYVDFRFLISDSALQISEFKFTSWMSDFSCQNQTSDCECQISHIKSWI